MIYGYPDARYRYLIHSHEGRTTGRKNYEKSTLEILLFSCSIWRIGYVPRIKRTRSYRYFWKLGKSREYLAPVQGSLLSKRREIEGSRARKSFLGGSPQIFAAKWCISKDRVPVGFLRNNREMERTLHQGFGVAQKDGGQERPRFVRTSVRVRKPGGSRERRDIFMQYVTFIREELR